MINKILLFLFSLVIFPMMISAQESTLKFHEITFIQKDSITNLEEYRKGLKENLNSLMHSFGETKESPAYKKMRMLNDSILNDISNDNFEKEIKTFSYKKINDSIISRIERGGGSSDRNSIINTKTEEQYFHFPYNKKYDQAFGFPFVKIKNLKIKEFREGKKMLANISCFKIKCTYQIIINHEEFRSVFETEYPDEVVNVESEMWVTEKIKPMYHPAFKVKEILEKYYPLDILETQDDIKGFERRFVLQKITLQES